jgi:hypothetical protein
VKPVAGVVVGLCFAPDLELLISKGNELKAGEKIV